MSKKKRNITTACGFTDEEGVRIAKIITSSVEDVSDVFKSIAVVIDKLKEEFPDRVAEAGLMAGFGMGMAQHQMQTTKDDLDDFISKLKSGEDMDPKDLMEHLDKITNMPGVKTIIVGPDGKSFSKDEEDDDEDDLFSNKPAGNLNG